MSTHIGWHTHLCHMLSKKQWTCQFYLFTIAFHQFWSSQKYASFIAALHEIDYFVHFTDTVPLISERGLKFCTRIIGWSRDGRVKKYINKTCRDNHIHYTSLCLLAFLDHHALIDVDLFVLSFSECSWLAMHEKHPLWLIDSVTLRSHPMHIDTQKASVGIRGMHSEWDYPYESCTFWPCHPYFILQFYLIVFLFFFYCSQCNSSMLSYMVFSFNSQWSIIKFARACKLRSHAPHILVPDKVDSSV